MNVSKLLCLSTIGWVLVCAGGAAIGQQLEQVSGSVNTSATHAPDGSASFGPLPADDGTVITASSHGRAGDSSAASDARVSAWGSVAAVVSLFSSPGATMIGNAASTWEATLRNDMGTYAWVSITTLVLIDTQTLGEGDVAASAMFAVGDHEYALSGYGTDYQIPVFLMAPGGTVDLTLQSLSSGTLTEPGSGMGSTLLSVSQASIAYIAMMPVATIPEPSISLMLPIGLALLGLRARRLNRRWPSLIP